MSINLKTKQLILIKVEKGTLSKIKNRDEIWHLQINIINNY